MLNSVFRKLIVLLNSFLRDLELANYNIEYERVYLCGFKYIHMTPSTYLTVLQPCTAIVRSVLIICLNSLSFVDSLQVLRYVKRVCENLHFSISRCYKIAMYVYSTTSIDRIHMYSISVN